MVYDGLLEQGSHAIQVAVINAGTRLSTSIASSVSSSATAALQLEWLLNAVKHLALQLQGSGPAAGSAGTHATTEQQRSLATLLAAVLQVSASPSPIAGNSTQHTLHPPESCSHQC